MTLLRTFIVWLLLLALPYQGYAAAAMMLYAPATGATGAVTAAGVHAGAGQAHAAMPAGAHDHAAMMAAMKVQPHDGAQTASHDGSPDASMSASGHAGHAHGGVKCGGVACCVPGAPMMAQALAVPALPAASSGVPFYSEFLHAVDLAHPERPPQGNFV